MVYDPNFVVQFVFQDMFKLKRDLGWKAPSQSGLRGWVPSMGLSPCSPGSEVLVLPMYMVCQTEIVNGVFGKFREGWPGMMAQLGSET